MLCSLVTDGRTDTHESDYCWHPFRVSRVFPSTCHQGSAQYELIVGVGYTSVIFFFLVIFLRAKFLLIRIYVSYSKMKKKHILTCNKKHLGAKIQDGRHFSFQHVTGKTKKSINGKVIKVLTSNLHNVLRICIL